MGAQLNCRSGYMTATSAMNFSHQENGGAHVLRSIRVVPEERLREAVRQSGLPIKANQIKQMKEKKRERKEGKEKGWGEEKETAVTSATQMLMMTTKIVCIAMGTGSFDFLN